ncbi:peptidase M20/M25/M40 [Strigomonas culicis]|uniref:Peptidase M20/M25/M40 n=1 Tax=Strigomonas culicis TaxID=28005 RepID=S9VCH2_9TRYP|nr:peptidase M20/M25/M40 [Strigomonas culicis]|eukprot:EPY20780.1 peptidase M20/M25/M40 [Strigomonas culicis]
MDKCREKIGDVDLMICLDSGCLNYDQIWLTTSLRGVVGGTLNVQTLSEGMHSGLAGGVVPDTFRIARELLDRVEDSRTGEVRFPEAYCEIPQHVLDSMDVMNSVPFKEQFATLPGVSIGDGTNVELAIRNFWKPSLTVTGANLPDPKGAGNVIRKQTALKLSLRIPPLVDGKTATEKLKSILEAHPPSGAKVWFDAEAPGDGCATPQLKPWLSEALNAGSNEAYGHPFACQGMGGAIPFIAMLMRLYPDAQFLVTGILGPKSNAHGPNEFLHINYVKGLTFAVSRVVSSHFFNTPKLKL